MKILHTSDWHIGRALYGRKRYEGFERFLDWLIGCIETERVGEIPEKYRDTLPISCQALQSNLAISATRPSSPP